MVAGIAVCDADGLSVWLAGLIVAVQVEGAAIQVYKLVLDAVYLEGIAGDFGKQFGDAGCV